MDGTSKDDVNAWYPESRRARIAAMREQAREAERRRNFRYGLLALAAIVLIVAAIAVLIIAGR